MSIDCLFFLIFVPLYFLANEPLKAELNSAKAQSLLRTIRVFYCSSEAFQWLISFWKKAGFEEISNLELEHGYLSEETIREKIISEMASFMKIKKIVIKKVIVLVKRGGEKTSSTVIMGKFKSF